MALPASLPSLSTREAIQDALYRCVVALDTADLSLFESAFDKDAIFDLNGTVMEGFDTIKSGCYDSISKLDTTHFITNIRIAVEDGASSAKATASSLAQHYRAGEGQKPGATRFLAGSLYDMDFVKDDQSDLWKIKRWHLKIMWAEGDWAVMSS